MRSVLALIAMTLLGCGGSDVSREIGARCDSIDECDDRCLGPSGEYPDGFCTLDCGDTGDCPSDSECVARDGGVCLFICFDNSECGFLGVGWACHDEELQEDPSRTAGVCRG